MNSAKVIIKPLHFMLEKVEEEYLSDRRVRYVIEPPEAVLEALKWLKGESCRDLNDFLILSTAVRYDAVLATYDEDLRRETGLLGVKLAP